MNTIGERLMHARKLRGYNTQADLAHAIGVTRGVIANIENNRYSTQDIVYNAICAKLNIRKEWLLTGAGSMEPENDRSKILDELYQVCATLSEPQQLYLLDTIRVMQKHNVLQQEQKQPTQEAAKHRPLAETVRNAEARAATQQSGMNRSIPNREK